MLITESCIISLFYKPSRHDCLTGSKSIYCWLSFLHHLSASGLYGAARTCFGARSPPGASTGADGCEVLVSRCSGSPSVGRVLCSSCSLSRLSPTIPYCAQLTGGMRTIFCGVGMDGNRGCSVSNDSDDFDDCSPANEPTTPSSVGPRVPVAFDRNSPVDRASTKSSGSARAAAFKSSRR